jgi:hypothetical protein
MRYRSVLGSRSILVLASGVFFPACALDEDIASEATAQAEALTFAQHQTACQADPRVQSGQVSLTECVGGDIFFKETFNGNGRTCASCHRLERNFAVDPPFIARLPANDALFIAENTSDAFALNDLERPAQMRARSLILENVDGTQPGGPNVRFVLRTVPHNLSMGVSVTIPPGTPNPPAERTGWSGDGAPNQGRLADFTQGAIGQHFTRSLNRVAGTDFRNATEEEGQAVGTYMRQLGRTNDVNLAAIAFSDAGANTGRQRFLDVGCNGCHNNGGANTGGVNRNFNTGVESARNSALASFPRDGGFLATPANADGSFGDGTFNSTPVIEAADSGPFFHTDTTISGAPAFNTGTATTIEQATAFYATPAFANRPGGGGVPLAINATDITNIGRFLRAINAIFNVQMASNRIVGARNMGNNLGNVARVDRMQRRMAQMALFELDDAIRVLSEVSALNVTAANTIRTARGRIETVVATSGTTAAAFNTRMSNFGAAFNDLDLADTQIAANVNFNIGNGTRMDCADPSADGQPATAACFNFALRNRPN